MQQSDGILNAKLYDYICVLSMSLVSVKRYYALFSIMNNTNAHYTACYMLHVACQNVMSTIDFSQNLCNLHFDLIFQLNE